MDCVLNRLKSPPGPTNLQKPLAPLPSAIFLSSSSSIRSTCRFMWDFHQADIRVTLFPWAIYCKSPFLLAAPTLRTLLISPQLHGRRKRRGEGFLFCFWLCTSLNVKEHISILKIDWFGFHYLIAPGGTYMGNTFGLNRMIDTLYQTCVDE